MRQKIIVFASGTKDGGGSGFGNLVNASRSGILDADIVAVVSNHERGGVRERADKLGVHFIYFNPANYMLIRANKHIVTNEDGGVAYRKIVEDSGAEWIVLSGWLKMAKGLDPQKTFNIHPALLSQLGGRFGGKGMYGHRIHEAVKHSLDAGEINESGFTMHFVTDEYDLGPVFFEFRIPLRKGMSADDIAKAVNKAEHEWQPEITNMVVHEKIRWDGKDPSSLVVPADIN